MNTNKTSPVTLPPLPGLPVQVLISGRTTRLLQVVVVCGFLALGAGLLFDAERGWSNVLLNVYYFLSLAVAGTIWVAIQYVANSGWGVLIRRIPEALTAFLPVAAVLLVLAAWFGMETLYVWSDATIVAENPLLQWKQVYLNIPFFFLRMIVFLGLWYGFTRLLIRHSLRQDSNGAAGLTQRNVRLSALFLVVFALTFVLASFDWIMSLEPEWYSTVFPIYIFSGLFLNGIAMILCIVILLRRSGFLPAVNENHLHDLGRLLFAFSIFWAYIWFSQFMLIWYSNIAEEVTYFVRRLHGGWSSLFYLNMILNWFIPFLALISRPAKRNEKLLLQICCVVMVGHWLDLYTMIMPVFQETPVFGFLEIAAFLGFLALFALIVIRRLERTPLVPVNDPYLAESIRLHT